MLWCVLSLLLSSSPASAAEDKPTPAVDAQLPDGDAGTFVFGPGDRFNISVYRHDDLDAEVTVAPDGAVTFPLLGRVEVAGKTYEELVVELEEGLGQYFKDVSVAVNVETVKNRKVFVVGEVSSPQVIQLTSELRILEALMSAGGINTDARTKNILLVRPSGEDHADLYTVDVDALMKGDLRQNVALLPEDIVVVPTKTIVNVERFFRRVSGILAPFVGASQVYRNVSVPGSQALFDDSTTE